MNLWHFSVELSTDLRSIGVSLTRKRSLLWKQFERLRHLLLRDEGFRLFTDHRNLMYVFDAILRDNDFKKQAADKLCQWASKLFSFKYVIEHIPGESNIWADILSRWKGDGEQKILRPTLKVLQWNGVSRLANEEFFWPGLDEIRGEQKVSAEQE
jgi:hypothetical protein